MSGKQISKTISLMRHAKSDWEKPWLEDHDRTLNARGRRAAPLIAQYIEEQDIAIDVILVSSAVRAQQTLDLLLATWHRRSPYILSTQSLYLASPTAIVQEIAKLDDQYDSVLIIGHNPGLGELASSLAGRSLDFPTACLAVFSVALSGWDDLASSAQGHAKLTHYCRPRELE